MRRLLALLATLLAAGGARAAADGPDAAGYHWEDSDEPGVSAAVPAFNPGLDLRALGFVGDDALIEVALPPAVFPAGFPFYGARYSHFTLSSNGWLSFVDPAGQSAPASQTLPGPAAPNGLVAFFWDDWTLEGPAPLAEAGENQNGDGFTLRLRVYSKSVPAVAVDLAVTLWQDGCLQFYYDGSVPGAAGPTTEIGIEDAAGTIGLPYMERGVARAMANFRAGYAVRFCPAGQPSNPVPPALGNVLRVVRRLDRVELAWTPLAGFPFSAHRLYRAPDAPVRLASRVLLAEIGPTAGASADPDPVHAAPAAAFYQLVAVSNQGDREGPY